MLFINGKPTQIGRFPNASNIFPYGFLKVGSWIESKGNYTQITDNDWNSIAKPTSNWTGGQIVYRAKQFIYTIEDAVQPIANAGTFRLTYIQSPQFMMVI